MKCTLVCELTPHSVSVAIFAQEQVFEHREYIQYSTKPTARQIYSRVGQTLGRVVSEHVIGFIRKHSELYSIGDAVYIHSLAWSKSKSALHHIDTGRPFTLSHKFIEEHIRSIRVSKAKHQDPALHISRTYFVSEVNGYAADSINIDSTTKVKNATICLTDTYIDQAMIRIIDRFTAGQGIHATRHVTEYDELTARMHTEKFAPNEYVTVFAGTENTEFVFHKPSGAVSLLSIPYGIASFERSMTEVYGSNTAIIGEAISGYSVGARSLSKSEQIAFDKCYLEFESQMIGGLNEVCGVSAVPRTNIVVASPGYAHLAAKLWSMINSSLDVPRLFLTNPYNMSCIYNPRVLE